MAAAMFAKMCSFQIESAGTAAWPGSPASEHAAFIVGCNAHLAQLAAPQLLEQTDFVICLAKNHAMQISPFVPHEKIRVLGGGISDPFGGNLEDYQACAAQIKAALPSLLPDLNCKAKLVPTKPAHLPAIAQLELEVFSPPASENKLREKLALDTCHMLTALIECNVAGFIIVDEIAGEAFIDDLAVFPTHRRKGIASRLLAQAELDAILRGCTKMHLEVRKSNAPARALYKSRGYQEDGKRKNFYQTPDEDAILMTLEFR